MIKVCDVHVAYFFFCIISGSIIYDDYVFVSRFFCCIDYVLYNLAFVVRGDDDIDLLLVVHRARISVMEAHVKVEQMEGDTLNEYEDRGAYHVDGDLVRVWAPRYYRRFHVADSVLSSFVSKDAHVVDIGSGEGVFVQRMIERGFRDVVGIDPYAPFVDLFHMKRGKA